MRGMAHMFVVERRRSIRIDSTAGAVVVRRWNCNASPRR